MNRIRQDLLAKAVRTKREELSLSQNELSDKTGINRAMISKIENGSYMPSISQLEDLQEVLHFSYDELKQKEEPEQDRKLVSRKIAVAGTGYVGMSIAVLLAQHNEVKAIDIIKEKADLINQRKSPIQDDYIEDYLANKKLDLEATIDGEYAYQDADYVVVAAPTNYDPQMNFFDTSAVEAVIDLVRTYNTKAYIIINQRFL